MRRILFLMSMAGILVVIGMGAGERKKGASSQPLNLPGKIIFQTDRDHIEIEGRWYQTTFLLKDGRMSPLFAGGWAHFTRDGKMVLYKREHTLYLFDLTAGQTKSYDWTAKYSPFDFDLSPNEQWLVFTSDHVQSSKRKVPRFNLMVGRVDGSDLTQLTDVKETVVCPRWSPDGRWILFGSPTNPKEDKEIGGLYKIRPDGSDLQRLFGPDPYYALQGVWSPDGEHIALAHIDPGEKRSQIYLMNADGTDLKKLTSSPGGCHSPVFSPDGNQILFLVDRQDISEAGSTLHVIDINGVNQRQVTPPQKIKKYGRWRWATDRNPDWVS